MGVLRYVTLGMGLWRVCDGLAVYFGIEGAGWAVVKDWKRLTGLLGSMQHVKIAIEVPYCSYAIYWYCLCGTVGERGGHLESVLDACSI